MNRRTVRPERLERLRKLCLSFPEASEKEAWGDPTWRVRDRIFAMQKGNYEGGLVVCQPSVGNRTPWPPTGGCRRLLPGRCLGRISAQSA